MMNRTKRSLPWKKDSKRLRNRIMLRKMMKQIPPGPKRLIIPVIILFLIKLSIVSEIPVMAAKVNMEQANDLRGEYLGQKKPGMKPEIFAPGIISTEDANEMDPAFHPDMNEFYFVRGYTYLVMKRKNNIWTDADTASFSGKYPDFEAFITHDGKKLFFISRRPPENWESYFVERSGPGGWKNARLIGENLKGAFYPTLSVKGNIYFTGFWHEGPPFSIYCSQPDNGRFTDPVKLPDEINNNGAFEALIAPDESFIIFGKADRPDGYGGNDLYISFRSDEGLWRDAVNMGQGINTGFHDSRPVLSPDGKYFFFSSNRYGTNDIFWINSEIIKKIKLENSN
ncbi:hypothetical protein ACFL6G_06325 [candidate division KSB1 bacterium]